MTYCDPWLSQRDFKWRKELARQNLPHFSQCFLKQAKEIRRKDCSLLHLIQLSQEWKLFNCCYYFFFYTFSSCHTTQKAQTWSRNLKLLSFKKKGTPTSRYWQEGWKNWQLQKLYSWSSIPRSRNNILMVLIPFGIVKIRKGYGLTKGPVWFFFSFACNKGEPSFFPGVLGLSSPTFWNCIWLSMWQLIIIKQAWDLERYKEGGYRSGFCPE